MPAPPDSDHDETTDGGFSAYLAGVGTWFGAWGMQQVLFSWIVVGELHASNEWVGIAQTSTMLPALLLLLAGGAVADRLDPRRMLITLHLLAALPALLLAAASAFGVLNLALVIVYGLSIGTIQAFIMPARDTLLSRVAGRDMMHSVTTMTATQFGMQAIGTLVAGLARWTGSATMLATQAALVGSGAVFTARVPAASADARSDGAKFDLGAVADGLRQVARNPRLRIPTAMVVAVGVLFIGPFIVVFPLLVRDYYQGGVGQLSLVLMLFPVGTIIGSIAMRRRGITRKGRAALIALLSGGLMIGGIGSGVAFPIFLVFTLVWGLCGAVFINCSRTLFQLAAPERQRGRVLAVYQLGFMGGAPIGAVASGFASTAIGLHATLLAAGGGMVLMVAGLTFFSSARSLD